jgi:hypothetical protein
MAWFEPVTIDLSVLTARGCGEFLSLTVNCPFMKPSRPASRKLISDAA